MHSPDLIQRIYFEKEKGNDLPFQKIYNDFRAQNFDFILDFDIEGRKIYWTCLESKRYYDIIKEDDAYVYFYLWDARNEFEIVIPGHTYSDELNIPILERTSSFHHALWVIGKHFPGLESISTRPIKIYLQHIRRMDRGKINKLNYWFKKMLTQYASLNRAIFEVIDYPNESNGMKNWKKIVDKKKW